MSISVLAAINGVICAAICLRLLTYQRRGSRHKPVISAFAAVLIFASGGEAMLCLLGAEKCVTLPQVLLTACMAMSVFAHKGNVSRCMPLSREKRRALRMFSTRIGW